MKYKIKSFIVDKIFQGINRLFSSFENEAQRINSERYCLPNIKTKDYNVMIDGRSFLDQPVKLIK